MTLSVDQQAELEKPKCNTAWFVELQFVSATVRMCNYGQTFSWGGYDWIGLGSVGKISAVDESAGVQSSAMNFSLNSAQVSLLALAVGAVEEYRNQPAKLYFSPLNEHGALIDTPEVCWRGRMDVMSFGIDGEEGQINLKCETSSFSLKRTSMRLNSAQQKQRYPTDTGFDYIEDLLANQQVWLTKKFQQI
jgi:hypothetical protein